MADTNAKTIQDLNQTTAVSGDDLVVVAQSGSNEATKATVSTLAEAVGELNSTGALSELSLATSIGKQQLAEALTEKGVPTTANETEIQMADKVRALVTNNSLTFVKGTIISSQSDSINIPTDINDFCALTNFKGYMVVHAGRQIHIVPNGSYANLSELVGASISSVDAHSYTSRAVRMSRSRDGNTVICVYGTNTAMDIYDINWSGQAPVISYVKTVTIPFSLRSDDWFPGITDDRELATACDENGNYMCLFLVNDTTVYKTGSKSIYISHSYQQHIYFDVENQQGYVYAAGNASSSGDAKAYKSARISYKPTTEGVTGSITVASAGSQLQPIPTSAGPRASARSAFIDFDSGLLIRTYGINITSTASYYTSSRLNSGKLSVLNLKDTSKPEVLTSLNVYATATTPSISSSAGVTNTPVNINNKEELCGYGFPVVKLSDTSYRFDIPGFEQDQITYDTITGLISRAKESLLLTPVNTSYALNRRLLCKNTNGYLYAHAYYSPSYYGQAYVLAENVITMIHLNFNNTPVDFPIMVILPSEINGLKTETVSVPLPEDTTN